MTAAVYRSGTPSLSVPERQNTAPVLEFNCLYTHDIRRKQKRWQDGFLRFHTFNKRVMVYDVPRNFIGDAHWKSADPLQDGDEVVLEKGGVIVQVAESVGQTETDLTELRQRKNKNSRERGSSPIQPSRPTAPQRSGTTSALGLKHRSLNALLGTPKGPIGKAALPSKSPFQERQARIFQRDQDEYRPAKRQRLDHAPVWDVNRTRKASEASSLEETPLQARTVDLVKQKRKKPACKDQRTLVTKEVIDLCKDEEPSDRFLPGFSRDTLALYSPARTKSASRAQYTNEVAARSSSPAFQRQKVSKAAPIKPRNSTADREKSTEASTSVQNRRTSEAVHRTSDGIQQSKPDDLGVLATDTRDERVQPPDAVPLRKAESRSGKMLRIAASAPKKKMLLCQDQLSTKSSTLHVSGHVNHAVDISKPSGLKSPEKKVKTQREQLCDRLTKIAAKEKKNVRASDLTNAEAIRCPSEVSDPETQPPKLQPEAITAQKQNALELAELNQMSMPPTRPPLPRTKSPRQETRQLRRVVSDASVPPSAKLRRAPGAPVRYTPSPVKKPAPVERSESGTSPAREASRLPSKGRSKKMLQTAASLNTTSYGTSTVILSKPFQTPGPPKANAIEPMRAPDPWSREAFDLFTWRPPGFDEES
jgi:hypothetical protein